MKILKRTLLILAALIVIVAIVFTIIYFTRFQTSATIQKITAYDEYNLYRMDIKYDYSIENIINYGITDNQSFVDAVTKEALPLLPVHIEVPDFGCSAFSVKDTDNNNLMGRNYDFKMIVQQCLFIQLQKMDISQSPLLLLIIFLQILLMQASNPDLPALLHHLYA